MKRALDIFFSGLAIFIFLPLLIPVALLLRVTGEGEVFFLQERVGRYGKSFMLYKFATMLKDSPNLGTGTVTVRDDPRVLPLGRFLRKTKINELPQLLNILIGDMSVVGPRPLTRETFSAYGEDVQKMIGMARPGLSGVGSIIFRSEEDIMAGASASLHFYREVIAPYKGEMEAWFYANHSLKIYFLVIFVTIWIVFVPNSTLPWRVFKGLPRPPAELATELHYPST